MNMFVTMCS